ncbi:acyl carrier protein [Pedobacter lusitanus]|uniref:Acyl carrier protein n=1 Tax=Pedobacter lusitanus TaxID=1503925 RepID=A0A0D0G1F6_9SPHI|nr:acyl carrier protein [Pedobacter lusitanus]KIO78634.1 acyl carrier protein [Pedobacter lusitanus]
MEEQKFVNNFALQFDETDSELIQMDTKFKDLDEWSSLTALSIMAMVDEEYGVNITAEDLKNSTTLTDLLNIINSKV